VKTRVPGLLDPGRHIQLLGPLMTLELRISNLAGVELCALSVASDWQGRQLKEAIAGKTQIPLSKQKLMYGTTLIRNTDVLSQSLGGGDAEKELLLIRQTVDFDFWLDEISRDYRRLRKAPEELRGDPQVVMEAINQNPQAIKFAADSVKADRDCALKALQADWTLYTSIALELWDDREIALLFVPKCPRLFSKLSPQLKQDGELVKEVLSNNNGWNICEMGPEMLADRELVLMAARNAGEPSYNRLGRSWLSYINRQLLTDKEVVVAGAKVGYCTIAELPEVFKEDKEVLRAVLEGNPSEIVNATLELPRDWALQMLRKDGMALKLLPQFCNDRECVEAAVRQTCFAISFASIELRADKELARSAIQDFVDNFSRHSLRPEMSSSTDTLPFLSTLSKEIRSDKELMLKVVQRDGRQLCVVEPALLKDPEVVYAAVSRHPMALRYVAERESEDHGYAKSKSSGKARNSKGDSSSSSKASLLEDVQLLFNAISRDRNAWVFCPKHLREKVKDMLLEKEKKAKMRAAPRPFHVLCPGGCTDYTWDLVVQQQHGKWSVVSLA